MNAVFALLVFGLVLAGCSKEKTAEYARKVARAYWDHSYPFLDPFYRSSECRDGGTMDVHPETSDWP